MSTINLIRTVFHKSNYHQKEDDATKIKKLIKWFPFVFFNCGLVTCTFIKSLLVDDRNESLFFKSYTITLGVVVLKDLYLKLNYEKVSHLLNEICDYSAQDLVHVMKKSKKFELLTRGLTVFIVCAILFLNGAALVFSDKRMPLNLWFPFNPKTNTISYWIGYTYLALALTCIGVTYMLAFIVTFLLFNCSLKYQVLGNQLQNLGNAPDEDSSRSFHRSIIKCITAQYKLRKSVDDLKRTLSKNFFIQITTSGLCICGSTYNIVFNWAEDWFLNVYNVFYVMYSTFDLFVIMYLGNEIEMTSSQLLYCLFQSNWIEQNESDKKLTIIFSEILKQPQQLVVEKIYRVNLSTFTSILNFAYSMFNLLQNM